MPPESCFGALRCGVLGRFGLPVCFTTPARTGCQNTSKHMLEDISEHMPERMSAHTAGLMTEQVSEYMTECISTHISNRRTHAGCDGRRHVKANVRSTCQKICQHTCHMLDDVSEQTPDLMPEQVSEHCVSVHMSGSVCQDSLSIHVPCLLPSNLLGWALLGWSKWTELQSSRTVWQRRRLMRRPVRLNLGVFAVAIYFCTQTVTFRGPYLQHSPLCAPFLHLCKHR